VTPSRRFESVPVHPADDPFPTVNHYAKVRDAVHAIAPEEGERRAWGTMIYACAGPLHLRSGDKGCGWEHRVWMLLGVEGPPELRKSGMYIPAPFFCGTCPECGGSLCHDRWDQDEEWEQPGRELPPAVAYFSVPAPPLAGQLARRGYGGAEYIDPTGRTQRAS
jgi:hypothetical protein